MPEKYKNEIQGTNSYYVDTSMVTIYSPEIENISSIVNGDKGIDIKLIGYVYNDNKANEVSSYEILAKNTTRDLSSLGKLIVDTSG